MDAEQRAAFRAFVREHHPDRGGDPEAYDAGLARFGPVPRVTSPDERRYDGSVEVVGPLPFPVRVGVALIRTWRRHRQTRVR